MSTFPEHPAVTVLLSRWQHGDKTAQHQLSTLVYNKLHQLAGRCMRDERANHTLQATALVNEAFISLVNTKVDYQDRLHFFSLAARLMRRILVDHARARHAAKRGDGALQVTLHDSALSTADDVGLITLHNAMTELAEFDPQKADILDLQFFAGLTTGQIALLYGVSVKTIERSSKLAKAWLHQAI
jgi:RNA polymerase sigma factor (TIGR02999 family)